MPKPAKMAAAALGAVLFLLIVVPFFIPKKLYLQWAVDAVESRYPVRLTIEDASLAFLPIVSVKLKNVTAADAERKSERILKADRLSVGIGWTDLLSKRPALVVGFKNAVVGDGLRADGDVSVLVMDEGKIGRLALTSDNLSLNQPGTLALNDENVSLKSALAKTGSKTELKDGVLKVGPQSFAVTGTRTDKGALDLHLASDELKLDYLKKILPGLKSLPPVEDVGLKARYVTDGSPRGKPTVTGSLTAKSVELPDQELKNVSANFAYRDPSLRVDGLKAETLGGHLSGGAALSLAPQDESYDFNLAIKNAAMDRISSVGKMVQGRGDLNLKGRGKGFDADRFKKSLNGDGNLSVREVRVPALAIFKSLAASPVWDALKAIPGTLDDSALRALENLDEKVNDLASAFRIVGGVVQVPKVNLRFPNAAASLSGGIGLDRSLDFAGTLSLDRGLVATFVKNPKILDFLAKPGPWVIPVRVSGTVTRPVVAPDVAAVRSKLQVAVTQSVKDKARDVVREAVEKRELPKKEDLPSREQIEDLFKKF